MIVAFSANNLYPHSVEEKKNAMTLVIAVSVVTALVLLSALAYLIRKVGFGGNDLPATSEWIDDLSLDRYRPMLRMLDGSDIAFLRSQPGFTPNMAKKLRVQRTQIFRGYLRSLETDFSRVCAAIKVVMLTSQHDRPELAEALVRQQLTFACAMLSVRFHLVLYSMGVCGVEVSKLVKIFDGMRLELRSMVPAAGQMAA
jgi:hypothetical protein